MCSGRVDESFILRAFEKGAPVVEDGLSDVAKV